MSVEGGYEGVYLRIATRRLGRRRGKAQFDNARAAENLFAQIWERQSTRRAKARAERPRKKEEKIAANEKVAGNGNSMTECSTDKKTAIEDGNEKLDTKKEEKEDDTENLEDYIFTTEDILGPGPSDAIQESAAWKKLQRLTGLKAVKESILNILQLSKTNYQRELEEKPLIELTFNRLFLGPPGTGKTVVVKLYG